MSMMNWSLSEAARSCAIAGVAASARLASNTVPNVSLSATKPAAMPAALWKNARRESPCLPPSSSAMASRRASTSLCFSLCGGGVNSSLETIWVGIGVGCGANSDGVSSAISCSVRKPIVFLHHRVQLLDLIGPMLSSGGDAVQARTGPLLERRLVGLIVRLIHHHRRQADLLRRRLFPNIE